MFGSWHLGGFWRTPHSLLILKFVFRSMVFCYVSCVTASVKSFWFCSKPCKPGVGVVVCVPPKKYRVPDLSFESALGAVPPGQMNERSMSEHVKSTKLLSHNLCGSLPPNTSVFFWGNTYYPFWTVSGPLGVLTKCHHAGCYTTWVAKCSASEAIYMFTSPSWTGKLKLVLKLSLKLLQKSR